MLDASRLLCWETTMRKIEGSLETSGVSQVWNETKKVQKQGMRRFHFEKLLPCLDGDHGSQRLHSAEKPLLSPGN